jgi:hypothetical protein
MTTTLLFIALLITLTLVLRAALNTLRPVSVRTITSEPTAEDYETYLSSMEAAFKTARIPTRPKSPRKPRPPKPKNKRPADKINPANRTLNLTTAPQPSSPPTSSKMNVHSRPLAVKNELSNIHVNACSSVVLSPSKPKQNFLTLCLAPLRLTTCLAKIAALPVLIVAVFTIGLFARRRPVSAGAQPQNHAA